MKKTQLIALMFIFFLAFSCQTEKNKENVQTETKDLVKNDSISQLLVKDYHPKSIYNIPTTKIDKAKFPVIDMHSHMYVHSEEEMDNWVRTMDSVGIDKTIVLTYETGKKFDSVFQVYSKYKDRFILFCGFDYTDFDKPGFPDNAVKELERCYQVGARGVGELGDKGKGLFYSKPVEAFGMHIDDERMMPLIKKCGELNMPISIHVAEPKWMYEKMDATNDGLMTAFNWRLDNKNDIKGHGEMVKILENAVRMNPNTMFIACHYANSSYDLSILGKMLDEFPNLYADIAARYAETANIPKYMNRFFNTYQDRMVYGSDMGTNSTMYRITFRILESDDEHFYEQELFGYHWALDGYGLQDEILEKIYRTNALKIINHPEAEPSRH